VLTPGWTVSECKPLNDGYIRAMLTLVSDFYVQYVLEGVEPPERMFQGRKDHQEFVKATARLARNAVVWEHIPRHLRLPGEAYDMRPFVPGQNAPQ